MNKNENSEKKSKEKNRFPQGLPSVDPCPNQSTTLNTNGTK